MLDPNIENEKASELRGLGQDESISLLAEYIRSTDYQSRMFGLRLLKRIKPSAYIIETFIPDLVKVGRLTELQKWYDAFMPNYNTSKLLKSISDTLNSQNYEIHERVLEMYIANKGSNSDIEALETLKLNANKSFNSTPKNCAS